MAQTRPVREYPVTVAGVDWQRLQKGDAISAEKIDEMWDIIYGDTRRKDPTFVTLDIREWLENARASINAPLVFRQEQQSITVLTDEQAVGYLNAQATAGLRKHRKNTRKMFTHIDAEALQPHTVNELERNQARHALIAAAADGARRQAVTLLRTGARLPRLTPPDL